MGQNKFNLKKWKDEDIDNTVEQLKEHLENIMELVRTESDEFEQQFRG